MAFTHIVTFTWREDGFDDTEIARRLTALASGLDSVLDYRCGHDAGLTPGNADFAIVGVFRDHDAFSAYRTHPEHVQVFDTLIAPNMQARTAVQWQD